jgi:hypothetical protein
VSNRANYYAKTISICPNGERITRSEKIVLMVLADAHQDGAHLRTYPRVATIAEDAMVSGRQCQRVFASLERKGVLRREYPHGTGRDRLTFYIFPELDEGQGAFSAVNKPAKQTRSKPVTRPGNDAEKGDKMSPLFEQEGCQKGDRRVTSGALHLNNKNNKSNKNKDTPLPPASGGSGVLHLPLAVTQPAKSDALELAVDQVMFGCGFVRRRLRRVLRDALQRRADVGELPATVALAMIEAWKTALLWEAEGLLRARSGPEKFFGDGEWCNPGGLRFDAQAIERTRNARTGIG